MKNWKLTKTFKFDGREVRYDISGEGLPLVLVHGTPWSSFNFRHLIKELSEVYTVYYFDLLGYGQSSKAEGDVSLGIQNQLLAELLNHWGLKKPVIIGHDFGGATALRTHLLNKQRFRKMILIDPVAVSPWGSPFFRHVYNHEEAFAGVPDFIHEAIVEAYVKTAAHKPLDDFTLAGVLTPWIREGGKAAFYRQIAQADSRYTDEVQPLYPQISTPTLILWGREDSWIPLEKGEELHGLIPGSEFRVIDDAGHLVIEEQPKELLNEISRFLEEG